MATGLIALLDDVAALAKVAAASLDDVAAQAGRAGVKAAGVVVDDAAVTPRYVVGFAAARELPIIWRIALGSLKNKLLFLLPAALLLSLLAPWAITPLLMLGLTGALGTTAEHDADGVYTGRLKGDLLHGPAKAEAVQDLALREGLDLSRCSAYSDSVNDLPMLRLVGNPCAINPDARLRSYARAQGWRIHDYRTGRKAARAGLVAAAVAGAVSGAVAAGVSVRGREHSRDV